MRDLAKLLKALGDETRLQILALLVRVSELCVCDFEELLGITQSKSSRHLRYLLNAGVLEDRREGLWVHYRLAKSLKPDTKAIIKAISASMTADKLGDLEKKFARWQARKQKECCL